MIGGGTTPVNINYTGDETLGDIGIATFTNATCDYDSTDAGNENIVTHNISNNIVAGMTVSGTGIPPLATIASITDSTHFVLSANTTGGDLENQTLTFGGHTKLNNISVTDGTDTFTCASVLIDSGTTFTSTAGTLGLTYESSNYAFKNEGTFTHNNGTVHLDYETGNYNDSTTVKNNTFYNFHLEMNRSTDACVFEDTSGSAIEILNNLTITKGELEFTTTSDTVTVHGLTNIAQYGTFANDADQDTGKITHHGLVTVNSGGTYKINDETTVKMNGGIRQLGTLTIA